MNTWICGICGLSGDTGAEYMDHLGEPCEARRQHPSGLTTPGFLWHPADYEELGEDWNDDWDAPMDTDDFCVEGPSMSDTSFIMGVLVGSIGLAVMVLGGLASAVNLARGFKWWT